MSEKSNWMEDLDEHINALILFVCKEVLQLIQQFFNGKMKMQGTADITSQKKQKMKKEKEGERNEGARISQEAVGSPVFVKIFKFAL